MTPLLPLDTFRELAGYHPYHFWQLTNSTVPVTSDCNSVVYQHNWQNVQAEGRGEILEAIENAETLLRRYLGYSVAPRYVEETYKYPEYLARWQSYGSSADANGRWLSINLDDGYVQALGIEQKDLIATRPVVYSAVYGTLNDTFTVTATLPAGVTDPDEIAIYFASGDRLDGDDATDRWRIQPVKVTISGNTATITGRAWLLVLPELYESIPTINVDPATSSNFATQVDVYRRYTKTDGQTNETSQGLLVWESYPQNWAGCCGGSGSNETDPASIASMIARVGIRNARYGIVIPGSAAYNATTGLWSAVRWSNCTNPDRITIRYLAGYPLVDGHMTKEWQTTVARLAMAELDGPICACKAANKTVFRWQTDAARTEGNGDEILGQISGEDLNNPFGTRRGHIYAWRRVMNDRHFKGFTPG